VKSFRNPACLSMSPNTRRLHLLVLVAGAATLAGCVGISPAALTANRAAVAEIEAGQAKDLKDKAILLADLHGTLNDWAADLADSELADKADASGMLKLTDAQAVLATYRKRQSIADKKVRELAGKTDSSPNYDAAKEMLTGVRGVLEALERRKRAEDELRDKAVKAGKVAGKRAKRGGF